MGQLVSELEIQFYDVAVPEWPGEEETVKKHLHCVFRFEMEHLLAGTGFALEAQ